MTEDALRKQAIDRLKSKRAFQQNVVAYVVVNLFLVGVWYFTDGGYFWPAWVMLGWGIGVVMHAWDVYGRKPITESEIKREMERGQDSA